MYFNNDSVYKFISETLQKQPTLLLHACMRSWPIPCGLYMVYYHYAPCMMEYNYNNIYVFVHVTC